MERQGSILLCHAPTVRLMKRRVFSRPGQIQFEVNAFSLAWSWHDKPKIPWQWSHVLSPSTRSYILMEYQRQRMIRPSTVNLPYPYSLWLTPHDQQQRNGSWRFEGSFCGSHDPTWSTHNSQDPENFDEEVKSLLTAYWWQTLDLWFVTIHSCGSHEMIDHWLPRNKSSKKYSIFHGHFEAITIKRRPTSKSLMLEAASKWMIKKHMMAVAVQSSMDISHMPAQNSSIRPRDGWILAGTRPWGRK